MLADLIDLVVQQPHLPGAALVERFRDRPSGEQFAHLLAQELTTPADGIAAELRAAIARLKATAQRSSYGPIPNDLPSKMSEQDKDAYRKQIEDLAKRG